MKINNETLARVRSFFANPKVYAVPFAATVSTVLALTLPKGAADVFNRSAEDLGLSPIETGNPFWEGSEFLVQVFRGEVPMSWDPIATPWAYYLGFTGLVAAFLPPFIFFGLSRSLGRGSKNQKQNAA